ncbi:Asp-tRNA(Asn)/Glu-tRNA(Gln) amidotransferase subunit GatC [Nitrososphaera sp.]|uniref:Asp-tRNA(Asn)/Glu-tRNA(Gln) amidotransferase subunit GatC n=1 Tax=Nitrososphaera sp. TaxID=1971748 RepID=UPI00307E8AA6
MTAITKEQVKHLGWLSRIELSDEEVERYASQIEQIVSYLDKLDSMPFLGEAGTVKAAKSYEELREDAAEPFGADPLGTKYRKDGFVKGPRMT